MLALNVQQSVNKTLAPELSNINIQSGEWVDMLM